MYGCKIWTVKKPECQKIEAFELWRWRRLLRVPWSARRLNQSILKKISPGISLEGMMLKLKLQYFGHLMQRVDLPGASVRNPARDKVMRKEADIRKACSDFRGPLEIPKHVPQQKSAGFCALLFHSSDILWKKSIQGFSLLHLKECFNPKTPLMAF